MKQEQLFLFCSEPITQKDRLLIMNYQKHINKDRNYITRCCLFFCLLVVIGIYLFFALIARDFSLHTIQNILPVLALPVIVVSILILSNVIYHHRIKSGIHRIVSQPTATIRKSPETFMFIHEKKDWETNESSITTVRFRRNQEPPYTYFSFGKSWPGILYDELIPGKDYRFYSLEQKYLLIIQV